MSVTLDDDAMRNVMLHCDYNTLRSLLCSEKRMTDITNHGRFWNEKALIDFDYNIDLVPDHIQGDEKKYAWLFDNSQIDVNKAHEDDKDFFMFRIHLDFCLPKEAFESLCKVAQNMDPDYDYCRVYYIVKEIDTIPFMDEDGIHVSPMYPFITACYLGDLGGWHLVEHYIFKYGAVWYGKDRPSRTLDPQIMSMFFASMKCYAYSKPDAELHGALSYSIPATIEALIEQRMIGELFTFIELFQLIEQLPNAMIKMKCIGEEYKPSIIQGVNSLTCISEDDKKRMLLI